MSAWILGAATLIGAAGALTWAASRRRHHRPFGTLADHTMLRIIAAESRTPEEFARRAEAWRATERHPLPISQIARAYKKAPPTKVERLIREAREEARERLWMRMSRDLPR